MRNPSKPDAQLSLHGTYRTNGRWFTGLAYLSFLLAAVNMFICILILLGGAAYEAMQFLLYAIVTGLCAALLHKASKVSEIEIFNDKILIPQLRLEYHVSEMSGFEVRRPPHGRFLDIRFQSNQKRFDWVPGVGSWFGKNVQLTIKERQK